MNYIAIAVLLGWLPLVVLLFNVFPPKKLVVSLYVCAWLFLPEGGFALPGLPDYTKMSGTVFGILLSTCLFDSGRLLSLRPRWIDLPMVIYCFCNFPTTWVNGLTTWDALSATMTTLITWGLPYLVGRAYLTDLESFTDLARAIAIGGLLYAPLCLIETRMSPILSGLVYGIVQWEGYRYGGYRPRVFLNNGLALGAWMMNAAMTAYFLWTSGTVKSIRNISFGWLTLGLIATSELCKSTGAAILLAIGIALFWLTKRTKKAVFIWLAIAVSPTYCVVRTFDLWSGREVVQFFRNNVDADRAQSFEYRLDMERLLADKALEAPLFGWGGYNRFQITNRDGKVITVPDGYWIILLGQQGVVGLGSMLAIFLLPMVLTIRRFPPSTWGDPRVAPVAGLALMMTIMMIDCLSNAMLMPLYPFAIGGLMGCSRLQVDAGLDELDAGHQLAEAGRMAEAADHYRHAIASATSQVGHESPLIRAEAYDGIGRWHMEAGRPGEAAEAFRESLLARDELAAAIPDPVRFRDLAIARDALARAFAELGDVEGAIEERRIALEIWEALAAGHPRDQGYCDGRAHALNDLSWLLTTSPGASDRDPAYALALAEEAVRIAPTHDSSWNTLGVARYRAGDWAGAIEALERSIDSSPEPGGTAFDHYVLAMACCQLHREDQAGEWFERGKAWTARNRPGHATLARFHHEAESLIRIESTGRWA